MVDSTISALTAAGAVAGANEFEINEAGTSKKVTGTQIAAFAANPPSDDGDSLGTTSLQWSDLFLAEGGVINFDNGDMTITQVGNDLTFAGGSVVLPAAATGDPGVQLQVGTLQTTPEVGSLELDANALYATTDAGNRGVVPVVHIIRAAAAQTLTNTASAQSIFDSPANGTITLETGVYFYELFAVVTGMSVTSGNAEITFAGGGTFAGWLRRSAGLDNTAITTIADDDVAWTTSATGFAASQFAAGTGTAMRIFEKGTFECSAGGTLIPSITLVNAVAATVAEGSYFMVWRMGSAAMTSVGQWS